MSAVVDPASAAEHVRLQALHTLGVPCSRCCGQPDHSGCERCQSPPDTPTDPATVEASR